MSHILPNGREALATDGATLFHIDLRGGKVTKTTALTSSEHSGQAAAISPDGKLVAAGDTYAIRIWEVGTGKELPRYEGNETVWSMTFTPDGKRLLSGGNAKVNVWDLKTGRRLDSISVGSSAYIQSLAASPDNIHCAAANSNAGGEISILRLPPAEK